MKKIILAAVLSAFSVQAFATSGEDVKHDAKKAASTAGDYTVEQKEKVQKDMEDSLASMKKEIADLKAQADKKGTEVQKGTQEKIAMLEKKEIELEGRMAKFKASSGRAWDHMKNGMSSAMKELSKSYGKAKAQFD
jgi:peptidoglycan hydrolase CwlO-like protein